jgi:aspartyl-tRNA synthetase
MKIMEESKKLKRIYTEQTLSKIGERVLLKGWAQTVRDHGSLIFIDIRDVTGIVQVVINPEQNKEAHLAAQAIGTEYVISVIGTVVERKKDLVNTKIPTGTIEVNVEEISVLNKSKPLPFSVESDGHEIDENVRFKYRFIDLRRARLLESLKFKRDVVLFSRNWFKEKGFLEVDTPILTVSSPEGARDFIVPSRVHKGKFYALPQAPQQFKQLLMVGGIDR